MSIAADLDLAPDEALKSFRSKGLKTSFSWRDFERAEHDQAFTVAKMMDMDLLADTRRAVDKAIAEGQTLAQFSAELKPKLQAAGWWGKQPMTDPLTGETDLVQLGSSRRLRTIFRTNMQTAYAAGSWAQIQDNAVSAPYLMYNAVDDNRTRPEHRAWNGTVLPIDSPWWASHTPPCGFNCRCSVVQLSGRDLKRYDLTVAPEPPPTKVREVVNPRTGETQSTPVGVDPGWGYNPTGLSPAARAAKVFAERLAATPADIGAASWKQAAQTTLPGLAEAVDDFVSDATWQAAEPHSIQARDYPVFSAVVGAAAPADIAFLAGKGHQALSAEIAIDADLVDEAKGLPDDFWSGLPAALVAPEAVLFDSVSRSLIYVIQGVRGSAYAVEVAFGAGKIKQGINTVRSVEPVDLKELADSDLYTVVRGKLR